MECPKCNQDLFQFESMSTEEDSYIHRGMVYKVPARISKFKFKCIHCNNQIEVTTLNKGYKICMKRI
jgi:hypothetical protein